MERYRIQILFLVLLGSLLSARVCVGQRLGVLDTAKSYIGIKEITGNNDHPAICKMLTLTGVPCGLYYCAAFNAYAYTVNGVKNPKSAWSPNWGLKEHTIWQKGQPIRAALVKVRAPDVFTIYYQSKGRIAHTGMIYYATLDYVITLEGNTGEQGSRNGDGFYIKKRRWSQIYRITSYIE